MDTPGITWQKVGVVAAILVVVLPFLAREAYRVVFPRYRLVYEVQSPITAPGFSVFSVTLVNDGSDDQNGISVTVPQSQFLLPAAYIHVSVPSERDALGLYEAGPSDLVHATGPGYRVDVGRLRPGESTRVTFAAVVKDTTQSWMTVPSIRVDSRQGGVQEGAGMGVSDGDGSLHAMLWTMSPYLVVLGLSAIFVAWLSGFIFTLVFDSPDKQMARLWRRMDSLQEKIDRERRYK